jgi:hypothetical protein
VRYASVEGTAGRRDFTRHQGLVVFSPGQTTATVPVSARRDRTAEGAEFYSVQLSSPTGAQLARTSAKVNIPANNT